jgi:lysophospholipase L1-like esterase
MSASRSSFAWAMSLMVLGVSFLVVWLGMKLLSSGNMGEGQTWNAESTRFFKKRNNALNQENLRYSRRNPYGFTDIEHPYDTKKGVFRIAVLGDSFVWGDGVPYQDAWSHRLASKLNEDYDSLTVMHWGRNGWSTLNELTFLQQEGQKFKPDLLLVSWVTNDPDLKGSQAHLKYYHQYGELKGERQWQDDLYKPENLHAYDSLIGRFKATCDSAQIPLLFVFTPNHPEWEQTHYDQMAAILKKQCIPLLRLERAAKSFFPSGLYKTDAFFASPVNAHPGPMMAHFLATTTAEYLIDNNWLTRAKRKQLPKYNAQKWAHK